MAIKNEVGAIAGESVVGNAMLTLFHATTDAANFPSRIRLDLAGLSGTKVSITRTLVSAGAPSAPSSSADTILGGWLQDLEAYGTWSGYDYTPPDGVAVYYTAWDGSVKARTQNVTLNILHAGTSFTQFTATAEPDNVPPRVRLDILGTPHGEATVVRSTPVGIFPGDSFYPGAGVFTGGAPGPDDAVRYCYQQSLGASGAWTGYDYEMPFGIECYYTAWAPDLTTTYDTSVVTVDVDRAWLVYPGNPSGSRQIRIESVGDTTRPVARGVFYPAGRRNAISVSDRRQGAQSSITVMTDSETDLADIWELCDLGSVLLLNVSPALNYGLSWRYISVGDVVEVRPMRILTEATRFITLPYAVTDAPVSLNALPFTWYDIANDSTVPSWRAVAATYASWNAVIAQVAWF